MWLKNFSDLVADKQYHKLDYHLWKNISKPTIKGIVVNLIAQPNNAPAEIEIVNDTIITKLDAIDYSFGEFLFENVFNEEERNMVYDIATATALEAKADYCEGLTATSASVSSNTTKTIDIDLNKVLSIDGDVAINGNLYTKGTDSDWAANTIGTGQASISSWVNVDLSTRPTFNDVEKMITDKINENDKKKEKEEMKGFNFDFGPCTGDQVRMSMYGLAVKNAVGTYVSYNPKSGEIVDVDVLNFDGAKFMYKIPVAIKEIAVGDIIVHNRKPMFVTALPAEGTTAITCVDVCAGEQKQVIPTVNMFGFNFVTKIVSLFNTVGDNAPTPDAPFGNMLPFMLMNEGTDKIDPMMMMFMMGGKMDMNNPMMLYFMLKDNKDTDMLPLLFMMQNK
jgi:3D (Asp-Asp-Asp) domain-containing protein